MEIIKYILSPSGFIAVCFLAGLAAWISKPTRKVSCILIPGAAFLYLVFSIGPISYALLKPLEFKHAMDEARIERERPRFLVVMAAYALDEDYYPVSSKVNANSLFRLVEAFRLWRMDPSRQIIITGHSDFPKIMKDVLLAMGVPDDRIMIENQSTNSFTSAQNVGAMVKGRPFVLVTSAGHMPRSMGVFRKLGMEPIPAPTDFQAGKDPFRASWLPTVGHLYYSELAIHEYFGLVWYRIRGMI